MMPAITDMHLLILCCFVLCGAGKFLSIVYTGYQGQNPLPADNFKKRKRKYNSE